MSCVLRAAGEAFKVGDFLEDSPLKPDIVYAKSESAASGAPLPRPRSVSGFNLTISERGLDDLEGQTGDAVLFLDEYEDELRRLGSFPGVETVSLEFGIRWREVAAQTDIFPSELLWRLGALDISLVVTHCAVADEGRPKH